MGAEGALVITSVARDELAWPTAGGGIWALRMTAWTALTTVVAEAGLERILRRSRQFFRSALARSPGARGAEWARLTAFCAWESGSEQNLWLARS